MKKRKLSRLSVSDRHNLNGLLFLLPFLIGFLCFYLEPIIQSITFSFSDVTVSLSGYDTVPVGLKNYKFIFKEDAAFNTRVMLDFTNLLWKTPVIIVLSLFLAILINQKFPGRIFIRAVFFLPVIFSAGIVLQIIQSDLVVSSMSSGNSLIEDGGGVANQSMGLNQLLLQAGIQEKIVEFVTKITNNFFSLIWNSGIQMLIFLSGLQSIPGSLYEAASVEGASSWESFCKITVPMLVPTLLLNTIYTIVDSYSSTSNSVMALITSSINTAKYGRATAMAWVYFVLIGLILGVVFFVSTRTKKSSRA
ncbi:MAG: sugar ABC transporter permease [Clostridia bacterium]|nr:sugar ABC transporter permease [Clostridia bacterium]